MQESHTLSPEHRALIAEVCTELALTVDEKATAMATLEDYYQRAFKPKPEFDYSQAVGLEAQRQMAREHWGSLGPIAFRAAVNTAVGDPKLPAKARSDAKRRQMRAGIKKMIGRMFRKRQQPATRP
jgi:hypothetical protein